MKEIISDGTVNEISEMTLLLNYKCNFSCAYCYSAKGRSNTTINSDVLHSALSFFINRQRVSFSRLRIVFSGGGEPLNSPGLLAEALSFSQKLANEQHIILDYGIVTNGSLISRDFIELYKQYLPELVVSFDILESVQNRQRNHYNKVCAGINLLTDNEIYPGIRCTVTPFNVNRIVESVTELLSRFPYLGGVAFEPVLNKSLFPEVDDLKRFYDTFINQYFEAFELGKKSNLYVGSSVVNDAFSSRNRACINKFTVTPEGSITACSRISSPDEDFFRQFLYGKIMEDNNVLFDNDKRDEIIRKNADYYPECQSCQVKWQCGGGCLLARLSYPSDYFKLHCNFVRTIMALGKEKCKQYAEI
ncbi:MAG: SPASM domain-containing protein [Prevotellaceae bacterium]|jgi:radical SAM protein with 4Fe4S-binding SPASM domain|nr:SPASM domain-containing protein [Prevotellaceae bacterium]